MMFVRTYFCSADKTFFSTQSTHIPELTEALLWHLSNIKEHRLILFLDSSSVCGSFNYKLVHGYKKLCTQQCLTWGECLCAEKQLQLTEIGCRSCALQEQPSRVDGSLLSCYSHLSRVIKYVLHNNMACFFPQNSTKQ